MTLLHFLPENLQHTQKKDEQFDIIRGKILSETIDQSPFTMETFTIELVSHASEERFPDNTLSSFTNFLQQQLKLEVQWEVEISERLYPSMYQNVTE